MMKYFVGFFILVSVLFADITDFMTYGDWTKEQKVDFAQKCLWSEKILKLDVHHAEMKCVDTANVLAVVFPDYAKLAALSKEEFNELLSRY